MLLTVLAVVLLVPLLILLNAFFVAAEFALVAVRRTKVETMVTQGVPGAQGVAIATKYLDRSIAAMPCGIVTATTLAPIRTWVCSAARAPNKERNRPRHRTIHRFIWRKV